MPHIFLYYKILTLANIGLGLPRRLGGKESACQAGDVGLIPGSGRSPGEGNGNPLQYCLGNPKDRGALLATFHKVARVGPDLATQQQQTSALLSYLFYFGIFC